MKNKNAIVAGIFGLLGPFGFLYYGWFTFAYCLLCLLFSSLATAICVKGYYPEYWPIVAFVLFIIINVIASFIWNSILLRSNDAKRANTSTGTSIGTLLMLLFIIVSSILAIINNIINQDWSSSFFVLVSALIASFVSLKVSGIFIGLLYLLAKIFKKPLILYDEATNSKSE